MFHVLRAIALAGVSLYAASIPVTVADISWVSALLGVAAAAMLALLYLAADLMVGLPERASKKLDFE